jgi:tetratricopeptide (TPR) repeat protein
MQSKQWDKAVADFRRVLEIDPENPDALNYLGYTWVDRGENLTEAFEMIRKAVRLEPESGAITDSLGWAHYKLGQYDEAKIHLEKAVVLTPASATIVDHLGDVYWKLGRFREAGYQWERALDFDPTDEEEIAIRRKLEGGLDAANLAP